MHCYYGLLLILQGTRTSTSATAPLNNPTSNLSYRPLRHHKSVQPPPLSHKIILANLLSRRTRR
jgi:hypothetical protein